MNMRQHVHIQMCYEQIRTFVLYHSFHALLPHKIPERSADSLDLAQARVTLGRAFLRGLRQRSYEDLKPEHQESEAFCRGARFFHDRKTPPRLGRAPFCILPVRFSHDRENPPHDMGEGLPSGLLPLRASRKMLEA